MSTSQGLGGPVFGGITIDISYTPDAKTVQDLGGHSGEIGGEGGNELVIGYEMSKSLPNADMESHNIHIGLGEGIGGHIGKGYTWISPSSPSSRPNNLEGLISYLLIQKLVSKNKKADSNYVLRNYLCGPEGCQSTRFNLLKSNSGGGGGGGSNNKDKSGCKGRGLCILPK